MQRKRSQLRRAGSIEQADHLAGKIHWLVAGNRSAALADAKNTVTKQLWALLKETGIKKQTVTDIDPNQINDYFASLATDPNYSCNNVVKAELQASHRSANRHLINYTRHHVNSC